ncbi:unnamed protein product [Sympodiomycopsis kandeliae]
MTSTSLGNSGNPSPLVAVLLITATSSRGPQLVFRYPRKPRLLRRFSKVRYYAHKQQNTTTERSALGGKGRGTSRGRQDFLSHAKELEEERKRDRDQWDEQEEDSGSQEGVNDIDDDDEFDSQSLSSLSSSSSNGGANGTMDGDDLETAKSESDVGVTTASSEAEDDSAPESVLSGSRRRGRRPLDASKGITKLTSTKHQQLANTSVGGSGSRDHVRSPSRVRLLASSLRDPTANSSPEREPTGASGKTTRRKVSNRGANGAGRESGNRSAADRANSPSRRARNAKAFSHYLGYPTDFLAELLAPKEEMCNRRFELVVDDLAFVGHPVLRHLPHNDDDQDEDDGYTYHTKESDDEENRGRRGRDGVAPPATIPPKQARAKKTPRVTMFHLVFVLQPPDPSYATPTLDLTTWLGFWYDNASFKMTAALWAEERRCEYVSQEASLLSKLWGEVEGNSGAGPSYSLHLSRLLLLSTLAKTLRNMFRSLINPPRHRAPFVTLNDSLDIHLQLPPLLVDPSRMVKSLLELGPSIEADDADLWEGAIGGVAGVAGGGGSAIASALDEWTKTTGPPLFPWKTLLLLHDPGARQKRYRSFGGQVVEIESDDEDNGADGQEDFDAELGEAGLADAGIELWARKFTSLLKPTLQGIPTFADLASLLSWDLQEDVYPMARHLIYYKQARVTDVPRIQNTYSLSPLFELRDLPHFATSFALRFPSEPPLARFLAALSSAFQPFIAHYLAVQRANANQPGGDSQDSNANAVQQSAVIRKKSALECLIWLLRHEIILQQHLRFRLIATEAVKRRAREMWEERRVEREERRRKREQHREWQREKRALKRGADPGKRTGELVPLVPQSAPDVSDHDLRAHFLAKRAIARSEARPQADDSPSPKPATRGRPRSRSAEGERDGVEGSPFSAASRVSSSSRSRSRNPPPLGRVGPGGRINPAGTTGNSSRPTSSSGLRPTSRTASPFATLVPLEASSPPHSGLDFGRRIVPRSRSPTSSMPIATDGVSQNRAPSNSTSTSGGETRSSTAINTHHRGPSSSSSGTGFAMPAGTPSSQGEVTGYAQVNVVAPPPASSSLQRLRSLTRPRRENSASNSSQSLDGESPGPLPQDSALSSSRGRQRTIGPSGPTAPQPLAQQHLATQLHPVPHVGANASPRLLDRRVSRSPSIARMRVRGFGQQEEVWIDGEEVKSNDTTTLKTAPTNAPDSTVSTSETDQPLEESSENVGQSDSPGLGLTVPQEYPTEGRRLSLVDEEALGESSTDVRNEKNQHEPFRVATNEPSDVQSDVPPEATAAPSELQHAMSDVEADLSESDDESLSPSSHSESEFDESEDESGPAQDFTPSLIAEPSRASHEENAWIAAMVATKEESTSQGFFRLLPYLNGRHTIDEVICREEMRRRELRSLLGQFKDEILTFVHP